VSQAGIWVPDPELISEWVEASTAAQGLPERVTDPEVIDSACVLLREGRQLIVLEAPDRREAGRVEGVASLDSGVDDHMIEHGADDGLLAGEG